MTVAQARAPGQAHTRSRNANAFRIVARMITDAATVIASRTMQLRGDVPTPALLLDLDAFESNIAKMAAHLKARGKAFRPHGKTHKCPDVAKALIKAGAIGSAWRG